MRRILLVDDNEDGRFAVVETIRKLTSYLVDEARDGLDALAQLGRSEYDLVLLDVQMPGMNGFEVCRRLRADPHTRQLPVLFLTATQYQVESRLQGLEVGADDFIVQPVSNQELVARINAALRAKVISDEVRHQNAELETRVRERTRKADQLADELRAERDTLRETFDVFEEALLLVHADGGILVENGAGRRLRDTPLGPALEALAAGSAGARPAERSLAEGGRSYVARAYPMAGGRVLLNVRDVTDERNNELGRLQAEKLASIGMLAAGVAHEINNPAAFVIGNIEALSAQLRLFEERLRAFTDPAAATLGEPLFEAAAILQESKEGMARIQRIVRDLSSFSHSADDAEASTDVNATVESTLTMLRSELRHRAAVERDLRAGRAARGSPARLSQVFLNLVMNAAQALDRADPGRNRIVVRTYDAEPAGTRDGDGAEPGDAAVIFEVSDNGPGIAPEVLPRIFDSFFTTKPRGVGTGLGLPISQGIVRGLGGEITVESRPGQGATFRVRLPVASVASGERSPAAAAPVVYGRRSVLAVDDEALLLKAYRRMLSDVHQVTTALGGREAIRLLERQRDFDVVLCDLQMPEMSGMELYATVRERFPEVADRFVFVTGGAFSADAQRFLEQAVTSIGKPFQVEELLALIEEKSGPHGAPAGETAGAALPGSPPAPSSPPQTLTERRE